MLEGIGDRLGAAVDPKLLQNVLDVVASSSSGNGEGFGYFFCAQSLSQQSRTSISRSVSLPAKMPVTPAERAGASAC